MLRSIGVAVVALAACLVARASPPGEAAAREHRRLEGTWRVVAAEVGGAAIPPREYRDLLLTFKAGTFTARRGDEEPQVGTYALDVSRNPRQMDITRGGRKQAGIYQLSGNTLKICASESEKDRPAAFDTRDNPGWTLLTLRRLP
jgi:uncharacterized protein (TIGR03067 family)